jgi:hypothetical protein
VTDAKSEITIAGNFSEPLMSAYIDIHAANNHTKERVLDVVEVWNARIGSGTELVAKINSIAAHGVALDCENLRTSVQTKLVIIANATIGTT